MIVLGDQVRLRAMGPGDADALWRWNHDPEVMRWMVDSYPQTTERARQWLVDRPRNTYADLVLGVETGGTLIGLVQLGDAEPETGCAALDIYLGEKEHWGRGHATDAVRTVCRYSFQHMRLHRIRLTVVTENHAARRVYDKVVFVEEGRLRESFRRDGRWYDQFAMGLLENELRDGRDGCRRQGLDRTGPSG